MAKRGTRCERLQRRFLRATELGGYTVKSADRGAMEPLVSSSERPEDEQQAEEEVDKARRKLLRALFYAAPADCDTVIVKPAHAQVVSCGPVACPPNGGPCPPNGGGCPPNGGPCGPSSCRPRS